MSKRQVENSAEKGTRWACAYSHSAAAAEEREMWLPSRSGSQWPTPIRRYTTIHNDTERCTRTQTRTASRLSSVTHFELYRTLSFVFFFTEKHNKTRDEDNKQQEQQLKPARRCTHWKAHDPLAGPLGSGQLPVWSTLATWRNAASRVDELTLKSQVGGRRR